MASIESWLNNQLPDVRRALKALKDVDFLHISQDPFLKKMRPRIGNRQLKEEDRTIPRICGGETVIDCIYGHSSVRTNILEDSRFDGTDTHEDQTGIFYIYRCNVEAVVKPSTKLVPDAKLTNELWVVPHAPECMNVKVEKVGAFIPYRIKHERELDRTVKENVFYLQVKKPIKLDKEVLPIGCYSFGIDGDLIPQEGVQKVKSFASLHEAEWKLALKKVKTLTTKGE